MTKDVFIKEVRDAEAMLYHISKSILKNDSDCGDAVQETILKAYEKLPTLKKVSFKSFHCLFLLSLSYGCIIKQVDRDFMPNREKKQTNLAKRRLGKCFLYMRRRKKTFILEVKRPDMLPRTFITP